MLRLMMMATLMREDWWSAEREGEREGGGERERVMNEEGTCLEIERSSDDADGRTHTQTDRQTDGRTENHRDWEHQCLNVSHYNLIISVSVIAQSQQTTWRHVDDTWRSASWRHDTATMTLLVALAERRDTHTHTHRYTCQQQTAASYWTVDDQGQRVHRYNNSLLFRVFVTGFIGIWQPEAGLSKHSHINTHAILGLQIKHM